VTGPLDASAWRAFAGDVAALAPLVFGPDVPDDERHRADGVRYLLRFLAAGVLTCVEFMDPDDPEFVRFIDPRLSWGLDNPDCNYRLCAVDPSGTYRITGDPGDSAVWELQANTGHFADGRATEWRCRASWGREAFTSSDDTAELVVGPFDADVTHLFLREYFGDWDAPPARLAVERVDVVLPPPLASEADLAGRLDLLRTWLDDGARCWWEWGRTLAESDPGPVEPFVAPDTATGLTGQAYGMAGYRCEPGEAVIVELRPPACRYWGVQLATWFWETAAVGSRQVSLNHAQAAVDPDGVVRMVVAHEDPGVANWLDAAGHSTGTLAVRYLDADDLPAVPQTRVPLERLAEFLPSGTKRVDPIERDRSLRRRRASLQRRLSR
jgi:hypothetical protein